MKIRSIALCGALLAAFTPILALSDMPVPTVTLVNKSDKCAWFTVYKGAAWSDWSIVSSKFYQPRFIKPGEEVEFREGIQELKVRAEVMAGPDCHGAKIEDTWDTAKPSKLGSHFFATLDRNGVNHKYFMKIRY